MARELDALIVRRERPTSCVSDNGTELTSMAILKWSETSSVAWHYIRARQAAAECVRGELHRPAARRVSERDAVRVAQPCAGGFGDLEGCLQHCEAAVGNLPPVAYAKLSVPVTQRDGALHYTDASAPRPVASPSQQG